jgi:hypothetical protein
MGNVVARPGWSLSILTLGGDNPKDLTCLPPLPPFSFFPFFHHSLFPKIGLSRACSVPHIIGVLRSILAFSSPSGSVNDAPAPFRRRYDG